LLAALFTLQAADLLARLAGRVRGSGRRLRGATGADAPAGAGSAGVGARLGAVAALALAAGLAAQGLLYSIHSGLVLSRADTRNLTRAWMVAHVPAGAAIVAEPVSPDEWARETRPGTATSRNPYRWRKYASLESRITPSGALSRARPKPVTIENYERTLSPLLIGFYERNGYCWVLSGSTQSGRAFADRRAVPLAIAYYAALARQGEVAYRILPYGRGARRVAFGFDWSFNYYPLAYYRPGPEVTVYRLHGGRCRA
jgi:hypothetical protein